MSVLKKALYVLLFIIITILMSATISKAKTVEITTETLNLRKEASTESNIVAQISIGEECEVLGEEEDWYKVKYKDYTGYISKEYTKVTGDNEEETSTSENTKADKNSENDTDLEENTEKQQNETTKTSNQGKLNKKSDIRIVPLINSNNIDTLKKDAKVTIINEINGWSYIQTDTISGWVRTNNITIEKTSNNDGKESNSNADKTDTTKEDSNSNSTDDKVDTSDNDNKVDTFEEKTMYATDYVNIRKEPSTSSDIIMVVSTNTALKVIGEEGDWYKVSTSAGNAYVSKDVVSDKKVTVTNRGDVDRTETNTNTDTNKKETTTTTTTTASKEESTSSSINTSEVVSYAKKFLGVPYVYGGASASGFDCSGFTMYVYNHFGISMKHGAQAQAKLGTAIKTDKSSKSSLLNNLKAGDLVFFLDYETMDEIGHCGIYIGNGNFIHASSGSGYCVKINSLLPGEYYNTRYCAARRIV